MENIPRLRLPQGIKEIFMFHDRTVFDCPNVNNSIKSVVDDGGVRYTIIDLSRRHNRYAGVVNEKIAIRKKLTVLSWVFTTNDGHSIDYSSDHKCVRVTYRSGGRLSNSETDEIQPDQIELAYYNSIKLPLSKATNKLYS